MFGLKLGVLEGFALGEADGDALGEALGLKLGVFEGFALGEADGDALGEALGLELGVFEGFALGEADGDALGDPLIGEEVAGATVVGDAVEHFGWKRQVTQPLLHVFPVILAATQLPLASSREAVEWES